MPTGTVKWFNNAKGFGFILPECGGEDLFAHYSAIEMDGYKTLKAGQTVVFNVVKGQKGMHATNIQVAAADTAQPETPGREEGVSESRSEARKLAEEHA